MASSDMSPSDIMRRGKSDVKQKGIHKLKGERLSFVFLSVLSG